MVHVRRSLPLLACGLLLLSAARAHAAVSIRDILTNVLTVAGLLESKGQQILFVQVDTLEKDAVSSQTYPLSAGNTYMIMAVGDSSRIQDIDLTLRDSDGDVVGKDNDSSNAAAVTVRVRRSQTYKMVISAYRMSARDGFYGVIIARVQ